MFIKISPNPSINLEFTLNDFFAALRALTDSVFSIDASACPLMRRKGLSAFCGLLRGRPGNRPVFLQNLSHFLHISPRFCRKKRPGGRKFPRVAAENNGFFGLALDRADGQALDKVLLEEGVGQDDGSHGDHGHGHTEGLGGQVRDHGCERADLRGHLSQEADVVQGLVDGVLQVVVLGLVNQQHAVEEVVPDADGGEQGDRGQAGHGQRQDDLDQRSPLARAVDARRLDDRIRDVGLVEGAHDEHPVRAEGQRQEQRPDGVADVQDLAAGHVEGNGTGREQLREEGDEGERPAPAEVRAGDRVGVQADGSHAQHRADDGGDDGVLVGRADDGALGEQELIGLNRPLLRPEAVAIFCKRCLTGK